MTLTLVSRMLRSGIVPDRFIPFAQLQPVVHMSLSRTALCAFWAICNGIIHHGDLVATTLVHGLDWTSNPLPITAFSLKVRFTTVGVRWETLVAVSATGGCAYLGLVATTIVPL